MPFITCTKCNGTGKDKMKCVYCRGTGFKDGGYAGQVMCVDCGGSGYATCYQCKGSGGKYEDHDAHFHQPKTCTRCNGSGKDTMRCVYCQGTGFKDGGYAGQVMCVDCGGSGYATCYQCKGSGISQY